MKKSLSQNKTIILLWRLIYILIQFSWGLPQTILGLLLYLKYYKHPHTFYHGSIRTKWNRTDGVSLGLFIFTPNESDLALLKGRDKKQFQQNCERMAVHEYGHTYQSLLLGPLYLPLIGLVSFSWARLPRYQKMRKKYGVPYSFCWTEQWANYLGEKILKKPSLK
ncbi:hypothetical protein BKP56_05360 [Marinilactibacillus sp. 15R]|uniref:hypothetical protein n=1 Tax=Marinilactibacillus sp. 15R TaxID=1911586 RepID=UPI00090C3530|nr:hypothetical protein [Marinilactibacillus sp. 15R]API88749.1 hypothetical protein BKP56_05360 [Marinilactibacillus sp. 15R]